MSQQPPLQVSRFLQQQVLLEPTELKTLLESLEGALHFYASSGLAVGKTEVSLEEVLMSYADYIQGVRSGNEIDPSILRKNLTLLMTVGNNDVYSQELSQGRVIARAISPVIMIQAHTLAFSAEDRCCRSMVLGPDALYWGLQFSYPQLYQDPSTQEVLSVDRSEKYPNTALYFSIQKWLRHNSQALNVKMQDTAFRSPIRLGLSCESWINQMEVLQEKGVELLFRKRT